MKSRLLNIIVLMALLIPGILAPSTALAANPGDVLINEVHQLRHELGDKLLLVTPGIRPGANVMDDSDDQTRVMTAGRALANGADHVVVGRPISKAADPIAVIEAMQADIAKSLG